MKAEREELSELSDMKLLDQFEAKVRESGHDIRPEYGMILERLSLLQVKDAEIERLREAATQVLKEWDVWQISTEAIIKRPLDYEWTGLEALRAALKTQSAGEKKP